jgi:FkbM family methyltransferase
MIKRIIKNFLLKLPKWFVRFIVIFTGRLGKQLSSFSRNLQIRYFQRRVFPWYLINGDDNLRLNYELDEESIVFDLGGYRGEWSDRIFAMYVSRIFIFEPVSEYARELRKHFQKNKKVNVYAFGLAGQTYDTTISIHGNASSIFTSPNGPSEKIQLKKAIDFVKENAITKIDLIKINIEGGEYDLLEHMIETGLILNVINIQVQFHDFVQDAEKRMERIQSELNKTHFLTYQYKFVWENWQRISDTSLE